MGLMVWGHRGHRQHRFADRFVDPAFENSLRAYEDTLAQAMGIECDVVQSRQATAYMVHDTAFNEVVEYELKAQLHEKSRVLAGNRFIYQMTDDEIAQLHLRDGQNMPGLKELLALMPRYPGRILNLELKGPHTVDVTVNTVERAIQEGKLTHQQVVFSSFNFPALLDLREKVGSRFKIGALFALQWQDMAQMYANWPNAPQDAWYVPFRVADGVLERSDLRQIAPDFFHLERSTLTHQGFDAIERLFPDAKITVWTAGEAHPDDNTMLLDTVAEFAPTGKIYAVITDFPQLIQTRLKLRGVKVKLPK